MTSWFTWHGAVNDITQHCFLKLVSCAIIWHKISHLKRRWKILRANQYYGILLFILTHVSFRKAVLLKKFPWILPHLNFIKKYNCIWCIKWCKYPCTLRTPHISSFTAAPGSTISPSSVAKLLLVSVNSHQSGYMWFFHTSTIKKMKRWLNWRQSFHSGQFDKRPKLMFHVAYFQSWNKYFVFYDPHCAICNWANNVLKNKVA